MLKTIQAGCYRVAMSAALVGSVMLAGSLVESVFAQDGNRPSAPVTVTNPQLPVTVDNSATEPALTSNVDRDGRIPYQSRMAGSCNSLSNCSLLFPVVPAGHRLVVRHISGDLFYSITSSTTEVAIIVSLSSGDVSRGFTGFYAPIVPHINQTIFDQPVLFYVDAGQVPTVFLSAFFTVFGTTPITLTGYLIDCKVGPCAPVAQ